MAALGTLVPVSPLEASDDSRHTFTADTTETAAFVLGDTPADFVTMDATIWQIEYLQAGGTGSRSVDLDIRIVNGATILAAADAGGTFSSAVIDADSGSDVTTAATAFVYTNTSANKTTWDGASVELRQVYSDGVGASRAIEVDYVAITGNYSTAAGGVNPKGALSHPFSGPFRGPI